MTNTSICTSKPSRRDSAFYFQWAIPYFTFSSGFSSMLESQLQQLLKNKHSPRTHTCLDRNQHYFILSIMHHFSRNSHSMEKCVAKKGNPQISHRIKKISCDFRNEFSILSLLNIRSTDTLQVSAPQPQLNYLK